MTSRNATVRRPYLAVLLLFSLSAFTIFSFYSSGAPIATLDSPSYVYFGADRPAGYPLFLALTHFIFGSYAAAVPLQLAILCASFGFLGWCFYRVVENLRLRLTFIVLLFLNPGVFFLAQQIMSDALSAAYIALFTAAVLLISRQRSFGSVFLLIAVTCVALTLRPVNIALAPAAAMAILLYGGTWRFRITATTCLVIGLLAAQQLTPAVHRLRGDPVTLGNPLARGLLQKTLFRQWPDDAKADVCAGPLIARATAPTNAYLAAAPEDIPPYLLPALSGYLRFRVIIPQLVAEHSYAGFTDADPILMCYAWARIMQDPGYFVRDITDQLWQLLTYPSFVSPETHARIETYLREHPPVLPPPAERKDDDFLWRARLAAEMHLPSFTEPAIEAPRARTPLLADGLRLFQIMGAIFMLAGLFLWPVSRAPTSSNRTYILGIVGLAFFGELLITAIVEIALPRYTFALWPLLCVGFVMGLVACGDFLPKRGN